MYLFSIRKQSNIFLLMISWLFSKMTWADSENTILTYFISSSSINSSLTLNTMHYGLIRWFRSIIKSLQFSFFFIWFLLFNPLLLWIYFIEEKKETTKSNSFRESRIRFWRSCTHLYNWCARCWYFQFIICPAFWPTSTTLWNYWTTITK